MGGMREFAFKHALTRDVVYSTLPRPERRELHRQVAEWIQDVARDRDVEAAELAAYHYGEALAYGEDDPAVARRAVEALLTASEAAFKRADFAGRARHMVERALALDADGRRARSSRCVRLGLHRRALGGASLSELRPASRPSSSPDDAELRSDVLAWRSRASWLTGRWDEALSLRQRCGGGARRSSGVASARSGTRSPLADRDAEAPGRGDRPRRGGDRRRATRRRPVRRGQCPDQPHHRAGDAGQRARSGRADRDRRPWRSRPASTTRPTARSSTSSGARPGYVPLDEIERAGRGRLGAACRQCMPPLSIGPYLELSSAAMLLLPAGRWHEVGRDRR